MYLNQFRVFRIPYVYFTHPYIMGMLHNPTQHATPMDVSVNLKRRRDSGEGQAKELCKKSQPQQQQLQLEKSPSQEQVQQQP